MFPTPTGGSHLVGPVGGGPHGVGGGLEYRPSFNEAYATLKDEKQSVQPIRTPSFNSKHNRSSSLKRVAGECSHGSSPISPATPLSPIGSVETPSSSRSAHQNVRGQNFDTADNPPSNEDIAWWISHIGAGDPGGEANLGQKQEDDREKDEEDLEQEANMDEELNSRVGVAMAEDAGGEGRERRGEAMLLNESDYHHHLNL